MCLWLGARVVSYYLIRRLILWSRYSERLVVWNFVSSSYLTTAAALEKRMLTHWGRDKIDAFFPGHVSNAFFLMKVYTFRLRFHWSLFQRVHVTTLQHWFIKRLCASQGTNHHLNKWWIYYWIIYASLGLNEIPWSCPINTDTYLKIRSIYCDILGWYVISDIETVQLVIGLRAMMLLHGGKLLTHMFRISTHYTNSQMPNTLMQNSSIDQPGCLTLTLYLILFYY